ncbi:MAG: VCBS repeat-containing protein [Planctomycetes bacterium]|nr:VCBS repeat-containing protein [Planctomycetota bacterium]
MLAFSGSLCAAVVSFALPFGDLQTPGVNRHPVGAKLAPTNLYGAPVVDSLGAPIEYGNAELHAQQQAWLAHGGTIPNAPLGGCETSVAEADWKHYAFGTGIGESNLAVSSVNGTPELVVTCGGYGFGGSNYWMILRRDAPSVGYVQQFVSPVYANNGVRWLEVANVDADASPEIVVLLGDGDVEVWDQALRSLQGGFATIASPTAMRVHDVDADGNLELVVATANALRVYGFGGALEWSAAVGGTDLAIGQMDTDPALELALTSGNVVDAGTHAVQWTWSAGFGSLLETGDIDDDGYDELIGTEFWGFSWAYDVDKQLPKWSLPIFNVGATCLVDIDADGTLELILGEAQWGGMVAHDTKTLAEEWTINNPEHGTTQVIVGDSDGDGALEVLWGAGHSSSGPDILFVGNWQTKQLEWQSVHLDGPFRGPASGNVVGDAKPEMVVVTDASDSGYGAGRILVFDADLKLLGISQGVAGNLGWSGTHEVILRDVDADPELEIVVATSTTYDGTVEIYDYAGGSSFTRIWQTPNPKPSGAFRDVDVLDLDGDADLEVVGCAGSYVYAYDYATGVKEWQSLAIVNGAVELEIGHTDDDPALEVLALGADGDLRVFDGETGGLEALLFGSYTCVEVTPLVVLADLVRLGDGNGNVVTFDYQAPSYQQVGSVHLLDEPIEQLTFGNADTIWTSAGGVLSLFYSPYSGALWSSCSVYGTPFGGRVVYGQNYVLTVGANGVVAFRRYK